MALSSLTGVTNAQLWDLARKASPTFKSHTAKATADLFTEKGFEMITRNDLNVVNEYFELSLRVAFQMLTVSKSRNPLVDIGLVEVFDNPAGGITQRIAINSVKPISPRFKGLEDFAKGGSSVDPYIIRKPESSERFARKNFDFQVVLSLQDYQVKEIFLNASNGMGAYLAGIMEAMSNAYTIQEYENTLECLNSALNSTTYPLQDTQIIDVDSWGTGTDGDIAPADILSLVKNIKDVSTAMDVVPQTNAYNAAKFSTLVEKDNLILLLRAGLKTEMELKIELGAFNPDRISLPFPVKEVEHFGGLIPQDANNDTLQPVYDKLGEVRGYIDADATINGACFWDKANSRWLVNITSGGATADTTFPAEPDHWYDPNSDVLAVLIQKGAIFEDSQNPYVVRSIENPAGLYRNMWASRPNTGITFDYFYTMVVFRKPSNNG